MRFTTEIRRRGYAYRTEQSYEQWIGRFILFCDGAPPDAVGASVVKAFLERSRITPTRLRFAPAYHRIADIERAVRSKSAVGRNLPKADRLLQSILTPVSANALLRPSQVKPHMLA